MMPVLLSKRLGIPWRAGGLEDQPALFVAYVLLDMSVEARVQKRQHMMAEAQARQHRR